MDRAALEAMSSQELHDRAMHLARRRLDIGFLWSLVKTVPAAEAAAGHVDEAESDVVSLSALLTDVAHTEDPAVAEALRPLYIDYLEKHGPEVTPR